MVSPAIQNFLQNLDKHKGAAKSERFYVQFTPPSELPTNPSYDLMFQCELSELPGITIEAVKYRFYGPEKNLALSTIYNEIIFEIVCTNDFYEKPFFDSWVDLVNPIELGWDINYKNIYTGTVTINQIDQQSNIIYTVNLINAWPSHVAPLPVRWADDSIHKLSVTFLYDRYTNQTTTQSIISGVSNPFIG